MVQPEMQRPRFPSDPVPQDRSMAVDQPPRPDLTDLPVPSSKLIMRSLS